MTSRDFCYWLQGFFEITKANRPLIELTSDQVAMIEKHLSLVFAHEIDPSMGTPEHQSQLNLIHSSRPDSSMVRC